VRVGLGDPAYASVLCVRHSGQKSRVFFLLLHSLP